MPAILLTEVSPGVYRGTWTIPADAPRASQFLRAHLSTPTLSEATADSPPFVIAGPPTPGPGGGPGGAPPPPGGLTNLGDWVNWLSDVIGWAVVFWGIVAGAHFVGIDNFLIALALLALTYVFRGQLVEPVQRAIRWILGQIIGALADVVQFVSTWLSAVVQHFQGNIVRAILRIVVLAAFMWVWELAQSIPAIHDLIDLVVQTSARLVRFVNETVDSILAQVDQLRRQVIGILDFTQGQDSQLARLISGFIVREVNSAFGQLTSEIQQLRVSLLRDVDVRILGFRAELTVFGQRIQVLPEEARRYITGFFAQRTPQALSDLGDALAASEPPPEVPIPDLTAAIEAVAEDAELIRAHLRGEEVLAADAVDEAAAVVRESGLTPV